MCKCIYLEFHRNIKTGVLSQIDVFHRKLQNQLNPAVDLILILSQYLDQGFYGSCKL